MSKMQRRSVSNGTKQPSVTAAVTSTPATSRGAAAEFNPDYTYVKKDLAKIGILAGTFITILIVLSFFLR
ncbi:MAG TPA: hypothetical protein VN376_09760 [Longilinea sp.]|nr:hypothetical protein [Longilinea sp.]